MVEVSCSGLLVYACLYRLNNFYVQHTSVWIVSPLGKRVPSALKIQSKRELLDQRQAGGAQRERSVMVKLDHPFVCKLVSTFQDEACIYMLIQFVQGGELLNLIQGGDVYGGLPESAAKFFTAGILEGLTHMVST